MKNNNANEFWPNLNDDSPNSKSQNANLRLTIESPGSNDESTATQKEKFSGKFNNIFRTSDYETIII